MAADSFLPTPSASSPLRPPLLSEARTPARCTSPPFSQRRLSDAEQNAVDWLRAPAGSGRSGGGWISTHFCSIVKRRANSAWPGSAQRRSVNEGQHLGGITEALRPPLWSDTLSFLAHKGKEAEGYEERCVQMKANKCSPFNYDNTFNL